ETVFRSLCKNHGADIVYSEMVSAEGIRNHAKNTGTLISFPKEERPIGIQLFGAHPQHLADAAQYVEEHAEPDFIDLNSGCPVPKILKKNGGAALLRDPKLFADILSHMTKAVTTPVTVKIRSGWALHEWIDTEYAKIAEDCGVAAIIVHPRSKTMGFSGHSYWERIALVKESVSIPVIGNGDITEPQHAIDMFAQTGCDSVMIGRGAYGNPWLFNQINQLLADEPVTEVSRKEKLETALSHLNAYERKWGELKAGRDMKKHIAWYVKGMLGASVIRDTIFRAESSGALREVIEKVLVDL
ncbi:MAG: tRNA dihydrouridine synthase DusB, partial [bacterium]|nr:tRNA dihydrouridine synthase DusB [bacterium]